MKRQIKNYMQSHGRGELAANILLTLAGVVLVAGVATVLIAVPGYAHIFKLFKAKNSYDKGRIKQSIRTLERRGFVKVVKRESREEYIILTPIGKNEALMHALQKKRLPKPKKWDRMWRLVMFDIPEEQKNARNAIRHTLQELGMYHFQKSVFMYPYECKKDIDFVAKYFKVNKYIRHATAHYIEGDNAVRKHFRL